MNYISHEKKNNKNEMETLQDVINLGHSIPFQTISTGS